MVRVGLLVRLRARAGKEKEVAKFLEGALPAAQAEPETRAWFAIQLSKDEFGIFDVFPNEAGRQGHLAGPIAAALMSRAAELLAEAPQIEPVEVLAAKLKE